MGLAENIYNQVKSILPTDDVDIAVAIIEHSVEDSKANNHPKNYSGLTIKEITRRLSHQNMEVPPKDLQRILGDLSMHAFIRHQRKDHYVAVSRFT